MSRAVAVLISDIHYNIQTLKLADAALRQAVALSDALNVPLIVAGDLHDTKANLRGECINAMLETFKLASTKPYVLIGNHDMINERGTDHALEFLNGVCNIVSTDVTLDSGLHLHPYASDPDTIRAYLQTVPTGSTIIMHQGVTGSLSGEYMQDKSALAPEDFDGYRVISGHYHARQDIKCGANGLFSYIGNPFTLNFGEANDPEKGFRVLHEDGSLDFVPTSLRKHVVANIDLNDADTFQVTANPEDLVWVKLKGTREQLATITRKPLGEALGLTSFKLDTTPLDTEALDKPEAKALTQSELLDQTIEQAQNVSAEQKQRLKDLWRSHVKTA